jgi:hypothetical protein
MSCFFFGGCELYMDKDEAHVPATELPGHGGTDSPIPWTNPLHPFHSSQTGGVGRSSLIGSYVGLLNEFVSPYLQHFQIADGVVKGLIYFGKYDNNN